MHDLEALGLLKSRYGHLFFPDGRSPDTGDLDDLRRVFTDSVHREIRALEVLKARYCRTLDTKDWDGFREVFTEDFVSDTSSSGGMLIQGRDEFVSFVSGTLANRVTVHHVQQPEIELTSPTTARGIWAMQDVVRFVPGFTLHGFGHYVETYEKADGQWRIKSSTLTRLREHIQTPVLTLFISDRIRRGMQRAARRRLGDHRQGA